MANRITNTFGLARCALALSTLLLLLFNDIHLMIPEHHFAVLKDIQKRDVMSNFNLFLLFPYENLSYCKLICIGILTLVISGYFPRFTCIFHWLVAFSVCNSFLIAEGGDQINSNLCLLIIPLCLADTRKNHWIGVTVLQNRHLQYAIFLLILLIKIQMAVLYLDAGVEKLRVGEWADGTALYYWMNHNMFGLSAGILKPINWLLSFKWIVILLTWSVIIMEILLFGGLFANQRTKYALFAFAISFHFFVLLIHGLPSFFLSMFAGLILFLWNIDDSISDNRQNLIGSLKSSVYALSSF